MRANLSILVVDDDQETLETMRALLTSLGAATLATAQSAEEASLILKDSRFDLILSDYQMEGMDGVCFTEQIRESGDLTPVLLLSGAPDKQAVIQALSHPKVQFFGKPFAIETLEGAVEQLLAA